MDLNENAELINGLQSGLDTLVRATQGLRQESANRKPGPGKWSILECVEHLVLAEDHMFSQIASASKADAPLVNRGREVMIRRRGADRSHKIEAPDVARPSGRFQTLEEAMQHFIVSRGRTLEFVRNCNSDLRAMTTTHPILGPVNCYEMLLIMSAHPFRHAEQIAEIKGE